MPSITDQISKYQSAAGGPKNVGGQPSKVQTNQARNTSIGKTRGTISKGSAQRSGHISSSRNLKPSMEGYMHAPSALIAGNNAGYSNPSLQKARYQPKGIAVQKGSASLKGFNSNYSNITDYRNTGYANNSIKKLKSIVKKRLL